MTAPLPAPRHATVDLTAAPPLGAAVDVLSRVTITAEQRARLEAATASELPWERNRTLGEMFRQLDPRSAIDLLKAGAKLALEREASGLRLLLGFLAVKRSGAEVLTQLRDLTSFRRVSLRLASGTWEEPEESQLVHAAEPIRDVLAEGARIGVLDLEVSELPRDRVLLGSVHQRLRTWFDRIALGLDEERDAPDDALHFLTQLAMLELSLMEKRVSLLASSVDPDDTRQIVRLLPIVNRYDHDIEHMKDVVSRIRTYEPFLTRSLTIEQVITETGIEGLLQLMAQDVAASGLGRIVEAMRLKPVLDREFAYHISQLYHIALMRAEHLAAAKPPDPLSIMLQVLEFRQQDATLALSLEPEAAAAIWPAIAGWGASRPSPALIETTFRPERELDFVLPDGTPRLPERIKRGADDQELTLTELVRRQMGNEPFILGILDNPKATAVRGLVSMLARDSRSLRVLDRIIRIPRLHTGETNHDVPRLLLANPAHIPIASLRPFIHVRFVSKIDLRQMARGSSDIRQEVRREVARYLQALA